MKLFKLLTKEQAVRTQLKVKNEIPVLYAVEHDLLNELIHGISYQNLFWKQRLRIFKIRLGKVGYTLD